MRSQLIQENISTVATLEDGILSKRSWDDRLIDGISAFFGSKTFAYLNGLFFAGWFVLNRSKGAIDPYPYQFLTLVVSLEAIFLSIFLLISQNRQSLLTERRSHINLQVNLLNEQETTAQTKILMRIAHHLKLRLEHLPEDMECNTDMRDMAARLDQSLAKHGKELRPDSPGAEPKNSN